jgi:hypothetical protein
MPKTPPWTALDEQQAEAYADEVRRRRYADAGLTLHPDGTVTREVVVEPPKPRRPAPRSWTRARFRRGR